MYQCKNCGTKFEGKFCPECGTKREERICRGCGAALAPSAKFCSECGLSVNGPAPEEQAAMPAAQTPVFTVETPAPEEHAAVPAAQAPAPANHVRVPEPFFTESRLKTLYKVFAGLPLALCGLFSFLTFMFCLAPAAVMRDILFGTGSQSLGSVYDLSGASPSAVLAFAAIGLAVALAGFLFIFVKRLAWRGVTKRDIPLSEAIPWLFQAVWLGAFASACAICADIQKTDGGMGALAVGAGPILIIVFSALFGLLAAGIQILRKFIAKKYPAFSEEERAMRAEWKARYAKPKAESDDKNKLFARVRSVARLKWACPWFVSGIVMFWMYGRGYFYNSSPKLIFFEILNIALIIAGIVFLVMKKQIIGKKAPSTPLGYLRKNRASMIACAVAYSFLAAVFFAWALFLTLIQHGSVELQLGQTTEGYYIAIRVYIALMFLFAFGLTLLAVNSCTCAIACKKLPAQMEGMIDHEGNSALLKREIARTPSVPRVRRMWAGFLTAVMADILITAIVLGTAVGSNIFSEAKLGKIDMGTTQYRVADLLGRADVGTAGEWYYYSDNAVSLMQEQKELGRELEDALMQGDEKRIEALNNEIAALAKQAEGMRYRTIRVLFDANSTVMRVEMFYGETGVPEKKHDVEATLSPARVSYENFAATEFTFTAKFPSYVRARLGSAEVFSDAEHTQSVSINGPGTYYLTWTDSFGNCHAALEVT